MEQTDLSLQPEIWAATPTAAQSLLVAQRERIRELEARLGQDSSNSSRPPGAGAPGTQSRGVGPGADPVVASAVDFCAGRQGRADQQWGRACLAAGRAVA
jgi:Family of unknown function (DUF6444)